MGGFALLARNHPVARDPQRHPEKNDTACDEGVLCEVLVDGHFGYAATADLEPRRACGAPLTSHCHHTGHGPVQSARLHRSPARCRARCVCQPGANPLAQTPLAQVTQCLLGASRAMAVGDKVVNRSARAVLVQTQIDYYATNGTHTTQQFDMVDITVAATAEEGVQSQNPQLEPHRPVRR